MMKRWILLCVLLLVSSVAMAQDATATQEAEPVEYAFEFPLPVPTQAQIDEAYDCPLDAETPSKTAPEPGSACEMAVELLKMAEQRDDETAPSEEEFALLTEMIEANPALALRLSVIAAYFNTMPFVAAPEMTDQPITAVHLTYTFAGLGPTNDYDITITNADKTPKVTGDVQVGEWSGTPEPDVTPVTLKDTVDAAVVQAFALALNDLFPIGQQFSSVPCWDYYPDWVVELTFADDTMLKVVTNQSNIIGIGGPWQVEIDGQNYMQYSGEFAGAVIDLLDALELPLGETAAMGCGGVSDPLFDAFPRETGTED
jgi:hypothetical protein